MVDSRHAFLIAFTNVTVNIL